MRPKEEEMWLQTSAFFFLVYLSQKLLYPLLFLSGCYVTSGGGGGTQI